MAKRKDAAAAQDPLGETATSFSQERQPGDEPTEQPKGAYKPVRSWTVQVDGPVRYRRFTDDKLDIIAFKFDLPPNGKLPDEVLAVLHDNQQEPDGTPTGLKFKDTRKHGKIWTLPLDQEGRIVADRIDFRLKELAHKREEVQGKTPF